MDVWILIPVPVRQTEFGIARQLLADLLEVEQKSAVPIKEVIRPVLAEIEVCGYSVNGGLSGPTRRVACCQTLHRRHGLSIGVDIRIDFSGTCSQPPSNGPVLDGVNNGLATSKQSQQHGGADEPEAFDKDSPADRGKGISIVFKVCRDESFHCYGSSFDTTV